MPDRKSKLARLVANLDSFTQSQPPRGSAGDHQVIIIRNDEDYAAAKQMVKDNHPDAVLLAILDLSAAA